MKLDRPLNLRKFTRLMTCSALALGLVAYAGAAKAVPYELDSGVPITITATAHMLETVTASVTQNPHIGSIGVHQDPVAISTLTLNTNGTLTALNPGNARIAVDSASVQPPKNAIVQITAAFPTTNIYSTYATPSNLHCAGCSVTNPDFTLFDVMDDNAAGHPDNGLSPGVGVVNGDFATSTSGQQLTDIAGSAFFAIGAVIKTQPGAHYYETGSYVGNINLTLSY